MRWMQDSAGLASYLQCQSVDMKRLQDKSILVIDDDTGMLRALDKVLTGEGAAVTRANWAGDAVEMLTARERTFDLVITDLRMPFVTGLTVVFAVRKIYPNLPIIVLTAFGSPDVKEECFRQGAAAFLEKPLNTAELLAAVAKVFASQKSGPEPEGSGVNHQNNFVDQSVELEKNRLNAWRQDVGPAGLRPEYWSQRSQQEKGVNL